jgi:hypothetical protein
MVRVHLLQQWYSLGDPKIGCDEEGTGVFE